MRPRPMTRVRLRAVIALLPLALLIASCGSSGSSQTVPRKPNNLATGRAPGVGMVVTAGNGRTLYVFLDEKGGKLTCVGKCAALWPLLAIPGQGKPATTSALHPNLVGTLAGPSGTRIVTYAGWPLHTYTRDLDRGSYRGQGNSGKWYMISPSGNVITKPVSSSQ